MNANTTLYEYVQKPSLRSRCAKSILDSAHFYAKKNNREKIKSILSSGVDDLGSISKTILSTKKHGLAAGLIAVLLPKTVQSINVFIQAEEEEKENAKANKEPSST